jgi:tetratricopeptide (TPR) repeat protein
MKAFQPTGRAGPHPHLDDDAEGADLLAEVPGSTGVLLWCALRDLMLWAETPADRRAGLFGADAGAVRRSALAAATPEQELWGPLLTLAQMTEVPDQAERGRLVFAARALARWAERRSAPGSRLWFAQAAALALPEDPRLALEAARIARDLGRVALAEAWFRHTVRRARGHAWETHVWAYIGLGVMYVRAGNYPAAQAVFGRARRCARKRRLPALEGASLHHLFTCAAEGGRDYGLAYGYARATLAAYGPGHPRIPALANDLARLWVHLGQCARALPVFEAIEPLFANLAERMIAATNVARAAAGAGQRARYESARRRAIDLISHNAAGTRVAEAWAILASADAVAHEWVRVLETAGRAVELADARGESEALVLAEAQLAAARSRVPPPLEEWAREPAAFSHDAARLADELLACIGGTEPTPV